MLLSGRGVIVLFSWLFCLCGCSVFAVVLFSRLFCVLLMHAGQTGVLVRREVWYKWSCDLPGTGKNALVISTGCPALVGWDCD